MGFLFTYVIRCIFSCCRYYFYKPKHKDPAGVYWLQNNDHFLYRLEKKKKETHTHTHTHTHTDTDKIKMRA